MDRFSNKELLQFAVDNGMIDFNTIQAQIEMNERRKYLEMHNFEIWKGTNDKWYTYIPDEQKGRILRKRNTEREIQDCIIQYYKSTENVVSKANMTLKTIFPEWIRYKQLHTLSTSYIKRITADWSRFYEHEEELINTPLRKLDKMYLDKWAHKKIQQEGLTKKAYYNMSIILRQCLDYAKEIGIVEENVFSLVKINTKMFRRVKKKASNTQVFTETEEEKLINDMFRRFSENPKSTAPLAVILAFELGLRIGEMCALKFSDIEGNYISIQRQEVREFEFVDEYTMKFKKFTIAEYTKSEDGYRDLFLTENARQIIELVREMNERNNESYEDFIFVKDGRNITHYSIQAMIKRGCEKVDMLVKTSHKIRKTYISKLIDIGLNLDEVRRIAGHSDEKTTLACYCYNRLSDLQTEEKIEKAIGNQEVIKGNQKIIDFAKIKNPEKLEKSRVSG